MKVMVIGVSGMLGSASFKVLSEDRNIDVSGTLRNDSVKKYFSPQLQERIIAGVDILDNDALIRVMGQVKPDVVINCAGLIKQLAPANDPLVILPVNAMFPHRLSDLCELSGARLVHISTDCVFDGNKGGYTESDRSSATDLYGKSKYIGELHSAPHAITLRTSIIGHELASQNALIEWFLAQTGSIKGYTRAVFSGLPTVELSRVIKDFVIPRSDLSGLYHVSADPISKFDLLSLVAEIYDKEIEIVPDNELVVDRSLNSDLFQQESGYKAPGWAELITTMKASEIVNTD